MFIAISVENCEQKGSENFFLILHRVRRTRAPLNPANRRGLSVVYIKAVLPPCTRVCHIGRRRSAARAYL